ncbi:DUF4384 domain-containing protein [Methylosinus sp. H3A]|uniref:DUF4384 domain-containing protein n=1 Tax=Methylosinus sp. H3A TaxID=2785786 RepID=UPI0018C3122E|nr:DUF4384 domain-containing protein [Methylosinus sp. H3A]MBG0809492.1 DUF4384 domain-containing protein [Methylosinus sp. H3A]
MMRRLCLGFLCVFSSVVVAEPRDATRSVRILDEPPAEAPAAPTQAPAIPKEPGKGAGSGVRIEVLPQEEFALGAPMSFRVTAEKSGYVILVDVDAQGKLAQIFPNMVTLADPAGVDEKANFLKAGQSMTLPEAGGKAAYRFVASPPAGVGMVVAILSDTPLQIVDLPDVPAALAGQTKAVDFVKDSTRMLQILPAEGERPTRAPKWSFATKFYGIK